MPSGAIRGDGEVASPTNQYAHSFAALAIGLTADLEESSDLWDHAERAVRYSIGVPQPALKLQEFNSLALLMLTGVVRDSHIAPAALKATLDSLVRERSFLYDGGRQVSNNWLAMRAVSFLMRARLTGDEECGRRGEALIRETLDRQLQDGVFVDYPIKPLNNFATPLTYHAKTCAMLVLAAEYSQQKEVLQALERGLRALCGLMSPAGDCLFYGRSCNSLFGLAAAYLALHSAGRLIPDCAWDSAAQRISSRLTLLQEEDGHFRLTPGRDETRRFGWDVYYHVEVYNAYAAALLLYARGSTSAPNASTIDASAKAGTECFSLPNAGLLAVRRPGFFAAFSTKGQCALDGSSLFCDMRYSGMQPLLIERDHLLQIPEPPLLWTGPQSKAEAVSPGNTGFLPYILWRNREYCARVYEQVKETSGEGWHGISGRGSAISLSLPSRLVRLIRRLRGKLTGHGDLAFTPDVLADLTITRTVIVCAAKHALLFIDGFEGEMPDSAVWQGPNARLMTGADMIVHSVLDGRRLEHHGTVPTSQGDAELYTCVPMRAAPPAQGVVSVIVCAPGEIGVKAIPDGHLVNILLDDLHLCLNLKTKAIETPI